MQVPANKTSARRLPARTALAALLLLLAFAVSAQAETAPEATATPTPIPASSEPAPEPALVSAEPEPSTPPEPVAEVSAAIEQVGHTAENLAASAPDRVASVTAAASRVVPPLDEVAAEAKEPVATIVAATTDNASELAGNATQGSVELAGKATRDSLEQIGEAHLGTAKAVAPLLDRTEPSAPGSAPPIRPSGDGSPVAPPISLPRHQSHDPADGWTLTDVLARPHASLANSLADSSEAGNAGLLPTGLPGGRASLDGVHSALASTNGDTHSGLAGERSNDRAPLNAPMPWPGSSGAPTGSSGSTFVPFAALLALLALAVPAMSRRLREAAACLPPTPFVCGLERPR